MARMTSTEEILKFTRYGDVTIEGCARRLYIALEALGISQSDLASAIGFQNSSITNMVKARQFPSRDVMLHLYFNYGVDFNFIYVGDIANLRFSIVERFREIVQKENSEADQ